MGSPKPPYFAVIFTSDLSPAAEGYEETAGRMAELASSQHGFLGFDSARDAAGRGITVSYWASLDAVRSWKNVAEHRAAQARGRAEWYPRYRVRIAEVREEYDFERG